MVTIDGVVFSVSLLCHSIIVQNMSFILAMMNEVFVDCLVKILYVYTLINCRNSSVGRAVLS